MRMGGVNGKLWYGGDERDGRFSWIAGCRVGIKVTRVILAFVTPDSVDGRSVDRMRYKRIAEDL